MRQALEYSIVRVRVTKDGIAGAGFLVEERRVLTCAHVVETVLEDPDDSQEMPGG
jgi:V8-like Glu-specific endopeptidase